MLENIVGKVENARYQHCLLFPQCFQAPACLQLLKLGIVGRVKDQNFTIFCLIKKKKKADKINKKWSSGQYLMYFYEWRININGTYRICHELTVEIKLY